MSDQEANRPDGAAGDDPEPRQPQHDRDSDIAEEQRRHGDVDDALAQKIAIGYETEDARVRPIVTIGIVSTVFLLLVAVGLYGLFNYLLARPFEGNEPA